MKILQLCKKFPYPLRDGESIAVTYLSKAMDALGADITLLAMNTRKHYTSLEELPDHFDHYENIHCVAKDNRLRWTEVLMNLFSQNSLHIERYVDEDYEKKLREILAEHSFDIIQLETLYMAPYIPVIRSLSDATIVMRSHNVEHEIWERLAENSRIWPKKWYLRHLAAKLKQYEQEVLNEYDFLVAITERDLDRFRRLGYSKEATVAPIGIDMEDYEMNELPSGQQSSISFIGSLDWRPNREGLDWFVEKVWNELVKMHPKTELHIAGRNTPDSVYAYSGNSIRVHGEVPSSNAFISAHPVMVVPLFSGSGMRAKILEGMALGRVVITTSLGLEGIPAEHGREVLIADTAEEFIEQLHSCLDRPQKVRTIGQNARRMVESTFDNEQIAAALMKTYRQFTGRSNTAHRADVKRERSYSTS